MPSQNSLLKDIRRVTDNPGLLLGEARKFATKTNVAYHSLRKEKGQLVVDRDWDNLLILDACRYDAFEERYREHSLEGELSKVSSAASQSWEFMEKNFVGRELHDTVYISANPYTPGLENDVFHALHILLDKWDEEKQTVTPETVIEEATVLSEEYPDKRLVIHLMQPHYPFLGPTGQEIEHRGYAGGDSVDSTEPAIWSLLQWGHEGYDSVSEESVWEAYMENVDIALEAAKELAGVLPGKSVATSDHGVLIGERMKPVPAKGYGHKAGLRDSEVTEVPWFEFDYEKRKNIRSERPKAYTEVDSDIVEDRLEAFGYR